MTVARARAWALACGLGLSACGGGRTAAPSGDAGATPDAASETGPGESAAVWPMYQRDPQHTGQSLGHFSLPGGAKWTFAGDPGSSAMDVAGVASDGTIYAAQSSENASGPDATLFAIRPDGTLKWRATLGMPPLAYQEAVVAPDDGITIQMSENSELLHFSPDGLLRWHEIAGGGLTASEDGTLYVGLAAMSGPWPLAAIDPQSGAIKWKFSAESGLAGVTVAPDGKTLYATWQGSTLYAVRSDGAKVWSTKLSGLAAGGPAIGQEGVIFMGTSDGFITALSPDGSVRWRTAVPPAGPPAGSPLGLAQILAIGHDGTLYIDSEDENTGTSFVSAITTSGGKKWSVQHASQAGGLVLTLDDSLIVPTVDGNLLMFSAAGANLGSAAVSSRALTNPPLTPDGVLYVGSGDAKVYALSSSP